MDKADRSKPGGEAVLAKLAEVLFIETLRRYMALLPPEHNGWLAGVRDPGVGKALALLHRKPAHPWTIASLGNEVGISRSVLAERFRRYLSETPMTYLSRWRLQLGAQLLTSTSNSVAQIAGEVGYESEQSFNRAFKRAPLTSQWTLADTAQARNFLSSGSLRVGTEMGFARTVSTKGRTSSSMRLRISEPVSLNLE